MSTSPKIVQAYLNLSGRCAEAIDFYRAKLGAEVEMMVRFKDAPPPTEEEKNEGCAPSQNFDPEKVMHASFRIGSTTLMASDCENSGSPEFRGISLALSVKTVDEAKHFFDALSDGGKVEGPFMKTFFSPGFGVVTDRFGVTWMVVTDEK